MQQHAGAFDVSEEVVPEPGAARGAFDQPGDVGQDEAARLVQSGDAELGRAKPTTKSVGAYELHEQIGQGAFAVVYRGTQAGLDRPVAIKAIRAELANRPEFIRRFEAEAHMVARLEHPHIVPLYDFWHSPV